MSQATGQWGERIEIKSESSSRVYVVSEKLTDGEPSGTYGCSCPGWKSYGSCKHLRTLGLQSCRTRTSPRPRGYGGDNFGFTDAAYRHYDVAAEGYGSADEWLRIAEGMAAGRGKYVPPRGSRPGVTADMRLLGLTVMPADVKGLVRAMKAKSRELHPDFVHPAPMGHVRCAECNRAIEAFTAMQMAYERLLRRYPR